MTENIRSNSAMYNENVGYGDKWHEQDDWLDTSIENIADLINKIGLLEKIKIERPAVAEAEYELIEGIEQVSDMSIAEEAHLVALKKCPNPFIVGIYLYYLREIRNLLLRGFSAKKVFDMVGKIDSKTLFDVVK